jgi:hypothetical protein
MSTDSMGNATNEFLMSTLYLFNPSLSGYKKLTHLTTYGATNGDAIQSIGSAEIGTSSAVNAIKFAMSSGNIASGEIQVYGVRA